MGDMSMSKFRFIGKYGEACGLALRLKQEGHEIDMFIDDKGSKNIYKGIIDRVDNPVSGIDKDTILIFNSVGFGKQSDSLKKHGFSVYGASQIADDLELDRSFGIPVAVNAGIEVPKWESFQDFKSAIKFVDDSDCAWVMKPEANKEGIQTYVSTSPEDMVEMLNYFSENWKGGVDFILQEVVEGTEVSSEVWVSNGTIVPNSFNCTWEMKRLMNGDLGPNTGCMASTVKFNALPWLYAETFKKLEPWLKTQKYNGPLDINCIVDNSGTPYFLEWTARFGYSAIYAFIQGLNMELGEFLETLAVGEIPDIEPTEGYCGALRVCIPPYPSEECEDSEGQPVRGIEDDERIFPLDVKKEGDRLLTAGYDGICCEVTHSDEVLLESLWQVIYGIADNLQIPNKMYRTDALENAQKRIEELEAFE
jgi:phosphoribosylamine--glycine ligase